MKPTLKQLWNKACQLENVSEDSKFVVFSPDNKYANEYNTRLLEILERTAR